MGQQTTNVGTAMMYSATVKDHMLVINMEQFNTTIAAKVARCPFLPTDLDLNH